MVAVNVIQHPLEISVGGNVFRLESTLIQCARTLISNIKVHRVGCSDFTHERRYPAVNVLSEQKVVMIRHQVISAYVHKRRLSFYAQHTIQRFTAKPLLVIANVDWFCVVARIQECEETPVVGLRHKYAPFIDTTVEAVKPLTRLEVHPAFTHIHKHSTQMAR